MCTIFKFYFIRLYNSLSFTISYFSYPFSFFFLVAPQNSACALGLAPNIPLDQTSVISYHTDYNCFVQS